MAEQELRNVATAVLAYTEIVRMHTGRGRPPQYVGRVDAIAGAARQLAEMVVEWLDKQRPSAAGGAGDGA